MVETLRVLLAEDDEDDYMMTEEAVEDAAVHVELGRAPDGQRLLDMLHDALAKGAPLPHLILLDLNMPRMGGREVIKHLRADARLQSIPIVVLTTSDAPEDIEVAYKTGVNSFITKPVSVEAFNAAIKQTIDYWGRIAHVPGRQADVS